MSRPLPSVDRPNTDVAGQVTATKARRIVSLAAWLAGLLLTLGGTTPDAWAWDRYTWSENIAVDAPAEGRQQGETALATDSRGRVWLAFIDAEYHQTPTKRWIAWPRRLRLFMSADAGKSFTPQPDLADLGGDQALAADGEGRLFASYAHYSYDEHRQLRQRIALKNLVGGQAPNEDCLPWDSDTRQDQSHIHLGRDGVLHVLALDIAPPAPIRSRQRPRLLYARSEDGGKHCEAGRRLEATGELAQAADTVSGLYLIGPAGYYLSADHGTTFPERQPRAFGAKLVRVGVSPDRRTVYAVGDSTAGGLWMHASSDGGRTWRRTRIDDAVRASAWRYPAVHVDGKGRIHVVWMDDRTGHGALYHAYADDSGASFSANTRVTDRPFAFPSDAPPPPPATQNGTWIGDYLAVTSVGDRVIVAWSDQRAGLARGVVRVAVGTIR